MSFLHLNTIEISHTLIDIRLFCVVTYLLDRGYICSIFMLPVLIIFNFLLVLHKIWILLLEKISRTGTESQRALIPKEREELLIIMIVFEFFFLFQSAVVPLPIFTLLDEIGNYSYGKTHPMKVFAIDPQNDAFPPL